MAWEVKDANAPKIALCVPHKDSVSMEWAHRTWGPLAHHQEIWCHKKPILCRGPPIHLARESIVDQALEWGADYLFFIDSDVVLEHPPNPNIALRRLMDHNMPIMSGLYRAKKSGPNYNPWAMWTFKSAKEAFEPVTEWKAKLVEVDVVGLGCCLIKREVFENTPKPWFRWELDKAPSEDFYFLLKAKTKGYKVIVDTTIRCSHIASMKILPTDDLKYDSLQV